MIRATIRSRGIRKTVYVVRYGERWYENAVPRWFSRRNGIKVASRVRSEPPKRVKSRRANFHRANYRRRSSTEDRATPAKYANFRPTSIPRTNEEKAMRLSATLRDFAAMENAWKERRKDDAEKNDLGQRSRDENAKRCFVRGEPAGWLPGFGLLVALPSQSGTAARAESFAR